MSKQRILALDGGGIRGVITIVLLERLSQQPGLAGWLDQVDLISGTSTGGLLALGLAAGVPLSELREIYTVKGTKVFDDSWLDDLLDLGQITGAQYDNKNLTKEMKRLIGENTTLGDLKKKVLITTFDLDNEDQDPKKRTMKPKLFHNFPGGPNEAAVPAYKVGLYTSAAPTYFPAVDGYVDGGVYANNPSMCALAQTQDKRYPPNPALSEVVELSLGTGKSLVYIKGKNNDWGLAQWAKPLISVMMDGVDGIATYQCKQLLGDNYHRLAPTFPPGVSLPLDAVDRVNEMVAFAEAVDLAPTVDWLKNHWLP